MFEIFGFEIFGFEVSELSVVVLVKPFGTMLE